MTTARAAEPNARWDRVGFWASSACAVHCLIAPLLFLAIPAFAKVWAHPASHALMAALVVPVALTVLLRGYRRHGKRWVAGAAVLGISLILLGSALPYLPTEAAAQPSEGACTSCCPSVATTETGGIDVTIPPATIVTVLGSLLLITAHIGNLVACRRCCDHATGKNNPNLQPEGGLATT